MASLVLYILISISNKSAQALSVLGDKGFGTITDKASAAKSTLETFNNLIKNGNTDQLSKSLDTALNAYNNLADSIENTKDKNGKLFTASCKDNRGFRIKMKVTIKEDKHGWYVKRNPVYKQNA